VGKSLSTSLYTAVGIMVSLAHGFLKDLRPFLEFFKPRKSTLQPTQEDPVLARPVVSLITALEALDNEA
jgi:hypothetical protein